MIATVVFLLFIGTSSAAAVEEWCLYDDSYLSGYSSGDKFYTKLAEAQEQCAIRTDCGGITQEPGNNDRYTLREGSVLNKSPSKETSWKSCVRVEEWCLYDDSYLSGGYSSGDKFYTTLAEALGQCVLRTDCGGITQEPGNNNRYTLREGSVLNKSPSKETSFKSCTRVFMDYVEDWCLYDDSYLSGYSSGDKFYTKLAEAQEQCALRTDCGGITQEPGNNYRYTLRKGSVLNKSPSKETSWKTCFRVEDWCLYDDSYLSEYSSGDKFYTTLAEAQEQCALRTDCGGITQEPGNNSRYTLRKGSVLNKSPSKETSFKTCIRNIETN